MSNQAQPIPYHQVVDGEHFYIELLGHQVPFVQDSPGRPLRFDNKRLHYLPEEQPVFLCSQAVAQSIFASWNEVGSAKPVQTA